MKLGNLYSRKKVVFTALECGQSKVKALPGLVWAAVGLPYIAFIMLKYSTPGLCFFRTFYYEGMLDVWIFCVY